MFSALALRQSSCLWARLEFGCPLFGDVGNAAPPRRMMTCMLLQKCFPTWLTTTRCWKEFGCSRMHVDPRNGNVGWPGSMSVYGSRVASVPGKWNVSAYD